MFVIYGKENCTFCEKAKAHLEMEDLEYTYKEVGIHISKEELQEIVPVPLKSVPQIFYIDNNLSVTYIGGYKELVEWFV